MLDNEKMEIDEDNNEDYCKDYNKEDLNKSLGSLIEQFDINKISILRRNKI